jgi:hypothetical protein
MKVDIIYNGEELTVSGDFTPETMGSLNYGADSARFQIYDIHAGKVNVYDDYDAPGHLEEIEIECLKKLNDYDNLF